jgi:hypothetical protein
MTVVAALCTTLAAATNFEGLIQFITVGRCRLNQVDP